MRNIGKHGKKTDKTVLSEIADNFRSLFGKKQPVVKTPNSNSENSTVHDNSNISQSNENKFAESSDLNYNNIEMPSSDELKDKSDSENGLIENSRSGDDFEDYRDEFSRDYYAYSFSDEKASSATEPQDAKAPLNNEDNLSDDVSSSTDAVSSLGPRALRRARLESEHAEELIPEKEDQTEGEAANEEAPVSLTVPDQPSVFDKSPVVKKKKKSSVEVVEDDRPLWEKNPDKYRKKKPFFVRLLGGLWSFIFFWILTGGVFAVLGVGLGVTLIYSFSDPELDAKLANLEIDYTSQILATDPSGEIVVYEELYSNANRVWVSINDMPQDLLDATIAIEDKRFYEHNGVDLITTVKATIRYVIDRVLGRSEIGAGGSTLTQQLIKVITKDNAVQGAAGIQRKFKEILRAYYIERKYNKDQILEYYLNTVNFGYQYEGIYTAAKSYFGKEPKDLTAAECATIVAVTNWPSYYNPYISLDNNKERRLHILYEMYDQKMLTKEEYDAARNQEIVLIGRNASSTGSSSGVQSYFTDLVFEWLIEELMVQKGYTRSYAIDYIYTSGLRIYTTVDPVVQQFCEDYFSNEENFYTEEADYLASLESDAPKQEVAFLLEDPKTGNVLAIIGGRGEKKEALGLNRVTMSKRQPGSSIKPLTVYGPAIEQNLITAATAIDDAPIQINIDGKTKYEEYTSFDIAEQYDLSTLIYTSYNSWPLNYDRKYRGTVDIKIALSNSYNAPSARVLNLVGVEDSFNFAKNMLGLSSLVDADMNTAPLSVGSLTYGVTVQEMVSAYTVFANAGIYSASRCVTRVETYDGKIILENDVDRSIVFTPQTAYLITDILQRAVTVGSSAVANLYNSDEGIFIDTAGKSGTTSSFNDRWFIGYTPYYLAGIWWGYDKSTYGTTENTEHIRMWHEVMKFVHENRGITEAEFVVPDGIVTSSYCSVSGKLPGPYCSSDPSGSSTVKTGKFKRIFP